MKTFNPGVKLVCNCARNVPVYTGWYKFPEMPALGPKRLIPNSFRILRQNTKGPCRDIIIRVSGVQVPLPLPNFLKYCRGLALGTHGGSNVRRVRGFILDDR